MSVIPGVTNVSSPPLNAIKSTINEVHQHKKNTFFSKMCLQIQKVQHDLTVVLFELILATVFFSIELASEDDDRL